VVNDFGANWGLIISSHGFQSGTFAAAANSNIRLFTWKEFQELFLERWFENYMQKRLREENEPLVDYTEPYNRRVFGKANKLDKKSQQRFFKLREKYRGLAFFTLGMYLPLPSILKEDLPLLPLRKSIEASEIKNLTDNLLDAVSFRDLLEIITNEDRKALAEFDDVFGERA
jgi:restriction system protein